MGSAVSREPETHAGLELLFTVVGHEHTVSLEDINEFVLPAVAVEQRR